MSRSSQRDHRGVTSTSSASHGTHLRLGDGVNHALHVVITDWAVEPPVRPLRQELLLDLLSLPHEKSTAALAHHPGPAVGMWLRTIAGSFASVYIKRSSASLDSICRKISSALSESSSSSCFFFCRSDVDGIAPKDGSCFCEAQRTKSWQDYVSWSEVTEVAGRTDHRRGSWALCESGLPPVNQAE
jgi:hypothetical protein